MLYGEIPLDEELLVVGIEDSRVDTYSAYAAASSAWTAPRQILAIICGTCPPASAKTKCRFYCSMLRCRTAPARMTTAASAMARLQGYCR
jgi:hypothetical protein